MPRKGNVTNLLAQERRAEREVAKAEAAAAASYDLSDGQWEYFLELAQQKAVVDALINAAIRAAGLPQNANVDITNRIITVPD